MATRPRPAKSKPVYLAIAAILVISAIVLYLCIFNQSQVNEQLQVHQQKTLSQPEQSCTAYDPNVAYPGGPHGLFTEVQDPTNPTPASYIWTDPTVCGTIIFVPWNLIEPSSGTYSWTTINNDISLWASHGKVVSLIVQGVSEQGEVYTPSWVLSQVSTVSCSGDPAGGVPVYTDSGYISNYEAMMKEVVAEYDSNPDVAYIRFGLGEGGESFPDTNWNTGNCATLWADAGINDQTWISHIQTLLTYEGTLHSSKLIVSLDLNQPKNGLDAATEVADLAVPEGIGLGNQGFNYNGGDQADTCASPSGWYALYCSNAGQVPLEVQASLKDDPPPDYPPVLQGALNTKIQIIELPSAIWSVADNPSDPNYAADHVAYQNALASAADVLGYSGVASTSTTSVATTSTSTKTSTSTSASTSSSTTKTTTSTTTMASTSTSSSTSSTTKTTTSTSSTTALSSTSSSTTKTTTSTSSTTASSSTTSTGASTSTIAATTTAPSGGGGGGSGGSGGGGGGGGSGGSTLPGIISFNNATSYGLEIINFSQLNSEPLNIGNASFIVVENYINPQSAGVSVNNDAYPLSLNQGQRISSKPGYYVKLLNVSYLPIRKTVQVLLYTTITAPVAQSANSITIQENGGDVSDVLSLSNSKSATFDLAGVNSVVTASSSANTLTATSVLIENMTAVSLPALQGYTKIKVLYLYANSPNVAFRLTMGYNASIPSNKLAMFKLVNDAYWTVLNSTTNSFADEISSSIVANAIVGLYEKASPSNVTTATITASTSTAPVAPRNGGLGTYATVVVLVLIILLEIIYYLRMRERRPPKKSKKIRKLEAKLPHLPK